MNKNVKFMTLSSYIICRLTYRALTLHQRASNTTIKMKSRKMEFIHKRQHKIFKYQLEEWRFRIMKYKLIY